MFLGLEWYWWLVMIAALIISIPLKISFLKWRSKQKHGKKKELSGKWGNDE